MVMDKGKYINKMRDHLYNSGSYKKLTENPISKVIRMVNRAMKEANLDDKVKKCLSLDSEITPRIYGAPKIHKAGVPRIPIFNTIGAPTYELAKYLANTLAPLVGKTSSYIKDFKHYVDFIKNANLEPGDKIVSFDVVQLFTKIPLVKPWR